VPHSEFFLALWASADVRLDKLQAVIYRLRKRIEGDPTHPRYVVLDPSAGYRFNSGMEEQPRAREKQAARIPSRNGNRRFAFAQNPAA
jgi:DNA-binding winged helix-turn-helix (wHTH) protein